MKVTNPFHKKDIHILCVFLAKVLPFVAILLASVLVSSSEIRPAKAVTCAGRASFTFTIAVAGKIGDASGTISLLCNGSEVKHWIAGSGDNNPADQCVKWDETTNNPWGGPIPAGTWAVSPNDGNNRYALSMANICGNRNSFQIHGWGTTHGCIAIGSTLLADFVQTVDPYIPNPGSIPLNVSYPGFAPLSTINPQDPSHHSIVEQATGGECVGSLCGLVCSVGGETVPVDKLAVLAPYIGFASVILAASFTAIILGKRVGRRKKNP